MNFKNRIENLLMILVLVAIFLTLRNCPKMTYKRLFGSFEPSYSQLAVIEDIISFDHFKDLLLTIP